MIIFRWVSIDPPLYEWVILKNNHSPLPASHQIGTIEELTLATTNHRVIGLAPSQYLTLTQVSLPTRNIKELRQALPYELEEKVLQDIDELHFSAGKTSQNQTTTIGIIEKNWLRKNLQPFYQNGIFVEQLIPDVLALPFSSHRWTILLTENLAWVKTSEIEGFCITTNLLSAALELKFQESLNKPESWLVILAGNSLNLSIPSLTRIEQVRSNLPLIELFAKNINLTSNMNFLQGEFIQPFPKKNFYRLWRPIGILAAVIAIIWVSSPFLFFSYLKFKDYQLNQTLATQYEKIFHKTPDPNSIPHLLLQQAENLKFNEGDQGFLSLFSKTGAILEKTSGYKILSLNYSNKQLKLHLSLQNPTQINQLISEWQKNNLTVKTEQIIETGKNITAQFMITERSS